MIINIIHRSMQRPLIMSAVNLATFICYSPAKYTYMVDSWLIGTVIITHTNRLGTESTPLRLDFSCFSGSDAYYESYANRTLLSGNSRRYPSANGCRCLQRVSLSTDVASVSTATAAGVSTTAADYCITSLGGVGLNCG